MSRTHTNTHFLRKKIGSARLIISSVKKLLRIVQCYLLQESDAEDVINSLTQFLTGGGLKQMISTFGSNYCWKSQLKEYVNRL